MDTLTDTTASLTRRTSAYTFTVVLDGPAPGALPVMAEADRLRDYVNDQWGPTTDSAHQITAGRALVSASCRLPDDDAAVDAAARIGAALGYVNPVTVHTGYGIHRRDVIA